MYKGVFVFFVDRASLFVSLDGWDGMGWIDELDSPHRLHHTPLFFFSLLDMDAARRRNYSPLYYPILHQTSRIVIDWEAQVASSSL